MILRSDEVRRKKEGAQSLLAGSLAQREGIALLAEIEDMLQRISGERARLEGRFEEFDRRDPAECLPEVAEAAAVLVFLEKWEGQLRERWVSLGL